MSEAHGNLLSSAFMRDHPAQAARVLEQLPNHEAATIFDRVPARLGAQVLMAMLPQLAADYLATLGDDRALELLSRMSTQPTVAILRHCSEPRRKTLIAGLPTAVSLASTLLLNYGEETLGAWADPDVVMLPEETRVNEALERLRHTSTQHAFIYVAHDRRRLSGVVKGTELLRASPSATLLMVMQPPAATLSAQASLSSSLNHPGWRHGSALPVVERGNRLIGVMTHDALMDASSRMSQPTKMEGGTDSLSAMTVRSYWQAMSGLLAIGLAVLPRVPPLDKETSTPAARSEP